MMVPMPETPSRMSPPDCNQCRHYFITHDADFRYGCRAFDFKSRQLPVRVVGSASGEACRMFRPKMPSRRG